MGSAMTVSNGSITCEKQSYLILPLPWICSRSKLCQLLLSYNYSTKVNLTTLVSSQYQPLDMKPTIL